MLEGLPSGICWERAAWLSSGLEEDSVQVGRGGGGEWVQGARQSWRSRGAQYMALTQGPS